MTYVAVFLLGCIVGAGSCVILSGIAMLYFRQELAEIVEWVAPEKIEPEER